MLGQFAEIMDVAGKALEVAGMGFDAFMAYDSLQLKKEAIDVQRKGIEAERAVALAQLSFLKSQLEAEGLAEPPSASSVLADYALPLAGVAVVVIGAIYLGRRRGAARSR